MNMPFWTLSLTFDSRADYRVVRSFSALHFDVTKASLASKRLSVLRTSHGGNAYGLQSFLSPIVFVSVEWTSNNKLQHSRTDLSLSLWGGYGGGAGAWEVFILRQALQCCGKGRWSWPAEKKIGFSVSVTKHATTARHTEKGTFRTTSSPKPTDKRIKAKASNRGICVYDNCLFYFQFKIVRTTAAECSECHVTSLILFLVPRKHAQLSCLISTVCSCS